MSEILIAVISGGSVVAVIEGFREWFAWQQKYVQISGLGGKTTLSPNLLLRLMVL